MPHQCLKCGKIFDEGSPDILKGCPECGGKKFFFTNEPLSDEKRKEIGKAGDAKIITRALEKKLKEKEGEWIPLEPRKVKEILANIAKKRKGIEIKAGKKPESISIKEIGDYEIDVKKLLDGEAVIIQKDGSYFIHLPSIFEEFKKK